MKHAPTLDLAVARLAGTPPPDHALRRWALVFLAVVLAFAAGRACHGHGRGCPDCDDLFHRGFEAGFSAAEREATVRWSEWR